MTFQPIIPASGNLGWSFLSRTREAQQEAFEKSPQIRRNIEYFRENIGGIQSPEALVKDYRLLQVALGAFGLDEDIGNRFYIRKVLEEGTLNPEAFANRLSDKRYQAIAKEFAFDLDPPNTALSNFADSIIEKYETRQFEVAVGAQDENLRLAMGLDRELASLEERNLSEEAAWFTIMGTPPLRRVFELALGLPPELGAVDLDRQLQEFRDRSLRTFGVSSPVDFADPELKEDLIRNFLFRSEVGANLSSTARGSVALSLLQSLPTLQ